jgi:site-specific DNA-adenine methylase
VTATGLQAPFPYFGAKRRAAPIIWGLLGDPAGYVEPFCGSAAVLLARPPFAGRRVETLNDADGWLVNTWRAIQLSPDEVARHAAGPVTEIDYHARLAWLQARRTPDLVAWLEGDPEHHDARAAGWWLYVMACMIGDAWSPGPWRVVDGRLQRLPHRADAGEGIHRNLPHLAGAGHGIHRNLPHRGDAGQAVRDYMRRLAHRLQRVRITSGPWERVVTLPVLRAGVGGDGARAVFLDPPYATSGDLYAHHDPDVGQRVREWCMTAPAAYRIVLCGYDDEHDALLSLGWRKIDGKASSGSGYSRRSDNGRRERLWLSPACADAAPTLGLEVP